MCCRPRNPDIDTDEDGIERTRLTWEDLSFYSPMQKVRRVKLSVATTVGINLAPADNQLEPLGSGLQSFPPSLTGVSVETVTLCSERPVKIAN